jgi:hypothetical protein
MKNKSIELIISKISTKMLRDDPISGIKGRFAYNIQTIREGVSELAYDIVYENAIPKENPSCEDLEYLENEIMSIYNEF